MDSYELDIKFQDAPGWRKEDIHVGALLDIIAATLKQLCEHPGTALIQLASLTVKRS